MHSGGEESLESALRSTRYEMLGTDDVVRHVGVDEIQRRVEDQDARSRERSHRYRRDRRSIPRARWLRGMTVGIVCVGALAACGKDRVSAVGNGPKTTVMVPVQSKSPQTPVDVTVGQSVRTSQGNVITLYQFVSPAAYAEAGYVIGAADIGVCASPGSTVVTQGPGVVVRAGISPEFFSVQLEDGTVQEAQVPGVKDPVLPQELLQPGQCARGWVTFHMPEQKKAGYVLFRSLSVIRWRVA